MSLLDKLLNTDPERIEQRKVERETRLSEKKARLKERREEQKKRREEMRNRRNSNKSNVQITPDETEISDGIVEAENAEQEKADDDDVKYIKPKHRKR